MRGFVLASLGLIALQVALRGDAAARFAESNNALASALSRFLSPSVAGIPQRKRISGAAVGSAAKTGVAGALRS